MTDPRTPTSDPVAPQTEAGRALWRDYLGGDEGHTLFIADILAIEAEARQQARAAFAAQVKNHIFDLPIGNDVTYSRGYSAGIAAARTSVLDYLAASPEPASPEAPGGGLDDLREVLADARRLAYPFSLSPVQRDRIIARIDTLLNAARPDGAEADADNRSLASSFWVYYRCGMVGCRTVEPHEHGGGGPMREMTPEERIAAGLDAAEESAT